MSTPAFIALGDVHLQKYIWSKHRYIVDDSYVAFDALVDLAIELYLPLVLVGDVFDSVDPGSEVVEFFRTRMDKCQEENIQVYVLQGNHDRQRVAWGKAIHAWPIYIGDGRPVDINGVDCVAFDFMYKDRIEAALLELSSRETKPQVLFLHQAVKQALHFEGKWNCDLNDIPPGIPLTVMGDIHREWELEYRPGQKAVYTGASHLTEITETGPKSCMVVNTDLTYERLSLPYREVAQFKCIVADQLDAVVEWIEKIQNTEHVLTPVAFLSHLDVLNDAVTDITVKYKENIIFVLNTATVSADLDIDVEEDTSTAIVSVPEMLGKLVNEKEEPLIHELVLAFLSDGESVRDVLNRFRTNFFDAQKGE
jgi:DNA repair exonuclease SbcCD nuclease subunit